MIIAPGVFPERVLGKEQREVPLKGLLSSIGSGSSRKAHEQAL